MNFSIIFDKLKQYPLATVCAVFVLICLVLAYIRKDKVPDLIAQEIELDTRMLTINKNFENSKDLEIQTNRLGSIVDEIDTRLFDPYERAVNINFFYGFEEKADVVISNINLLPEPDPIYDDKGPRALKLHSTLTYDLKLSGSFGNILKFFHEIEQDEHFLRITDFQVSSGGGELGARKVNARVSVLVLARKN